MSYPQPHQDSHQFSDKDRDRLALHHTLGTSPTQAATGDHNHDGENGHKLTSYTLTGKLTPANVGEVDAIVDQLITILSRFVTITDSRT